MAGIKALRKIQIGREVEAGTPVAATTVWRGVGTIEDQREVAFATEDVGILGGVDRTYVAKLAAGLALEETELTFEQICYLLEMGLGAATPVADDDGSGIIRAYAIPYDTVPSIATYTVRAGDNQRVEVMEYTFAQKVTISGKPGEAWKVSADLVGRQAQDGVFTAGLVLPKVETALFGRTVLSIDAIDGVAGTTRKAGTLLGASLEITTGLVPQFLGDNLYFTTHRMSKPDVALSITFVHDGSAATEIAAWRAQTPRLVQLAIAGSALATPGDEEQKAIRATLAGKWEKFSKIGEEDGGDIVTGTFRVKYNETAGQAGEIVVVNELEALP